MESVRVRKSLESRRFPYRDDARFVRMNRTNGLVRATIRSRAGSKCGTLSGPGEARVASDRVRTALGNLIESGDDRWRMIGGLVTGKVPVG